MDELERYKEITSKLSSLSKDKRWSMNEIIEVVLDSGEVVKVGPFSEEYLPSKGDYFSDDLWFWQENSSKDIYVIYANAESVDSWGEHYDNFGVRFDIGKIEKYVPVIQSTDYF